MAGRLNPRGERDGPSARPWGRSGQDGAGGVPGRATRPRQNATEAAAQTRVPGALDSDVTGVPCVGWAALASSDQRPMPRLP